MTNQTISLVTLVVRDYDEAIAFYVDVLGFDLIDDTYQPEQDKRWVVVRPKGEAQTGMLLARATSREQEIAVGNQTGGRVGFFLRTDDFWRDYELYKSRGVEFTRDPVEQPYGTVAVFNDLYGMQWDLLG